MPITRHIHAASPALQDTTSAGLRGWIREVVLLCDGLVAHPLEAQVARPVISLPLGPLFRAWDFWFETTLQVPALAGCTLKLLHRRDLREHHRGLGAATPLWIGVPDRGSHRGTAGVLRDACLGDGMPPDDWLLVAHGRQFPDPSLPHVLTELEQPGADTEVVLLHQRKRFAGAWLLRRRVLCRVAPLGFVDFKEQLLQRLVASDHIRDRSLSRPILRDVRTRNAYLDCVKAYANRNRQPGSPPPSPGSVSFGFVEGIVSPPPSVQLFDSVILSGASLPTRCTLVRSVAAAGGSVHDDALIRDQIVRSRNSPLLPILPHRLLRQIWPA